MKSIFLFSLVAMLSLSLAGQTQQYDGQFYPEGTTWVTASVSLDRNFIESYSFIEVKGDTVLDGKTYKCVYGNNRLTEFLREDEFKKVYLRMIDYNQVYYEGGRVSDEFVIYDFDWEVGKVLETYSSPDDTEPSRYEITEINQFTLLDGSTCNYVTFWEGNRLLQGIGEERGIFVTGITSPDGFVPALYSFARGGIQLYQYGDKVPEEFHKYYPDGTTWVEEREITNGESDSELVYDTFEVRGDTVLNGRQYMKIYCN